jgi:DNA-directed RNA polymerase specialized sigma24 family protein
MSRPRTRTISWAYPENVDLEKADEFIKKWAGYAIWCAFFFHKKRINSDHTLRAAALDACFKVYLKIEDGLIEKGLEERRIKGWIRKLLTAVAYDMARMEGIIPAHADSVWFPKAWISWEEYFSGAAREASTVEEIARREVFHHLLNDNQKYGRRSKEDIQRQKDVMALYLDGYSYNEISDKLGLKPNCVWATVQAAASRASRRFRDNNGDGVVYEEVKPELPSSKINT